MKVILQSLKNTTTLEIEEPITALALYNDTLVVGSESQIEIWNLLTDDDPKTLKTNMYAMLVALHDDLAAVMGQRGTLRIWNIKTGVLLKTIIGFFYDHGIAALALNNQWVVALSIHYKRAWPLSLNLQGTAHENPLVWITENANILQGNLIRRVCQATKDKNSFIIELPKKLSVIKNNETREQMDGRTYFTFPSAMRAYLRNYLRIVARETIPLSHAL